MWPLSSAHGSLSASTFFNTLARYLRSFLKPFVTMVALCSECIWGVRANASCSARQRRRFDVQQERVVECTTMQYKGNRVCPVR